MKKKWYQWALEYKDWNVRTGERCNSVMKAIPWFRTNVAMFGEPVRDAISTSLSNRLKRWQLDLLNGSGSISAERGLVTFGGQDPSNSWKEDILGLFQRLLCWFAAPNWWTMTLPQYIKVLQRRVVPEIAKTFPDLGYTNKTLHQRCINIGDPIFPARGYIRVLDWTDNLPDKIGLQICSHLSRRDYKERTVPWGRSSLRP